MINILLSIILLPFAALSVVFTIAACIGFLRGVRNGFNRKKN